MMNGGILQISNPRDRWVMQLDIEAISKRAGVYGVDRTITPLGGIQEERCILLPMSNTRKIIKLILMWAPDSDIDAVEQIFERSGNRKLWDAWVKMRAKGRKV